MADYAYPYDPDGTNAANLVKAEQHPLVNYPNAWRCIIPLYAPFYRKDLTLRIVETGRILYEGLDYYLGHYYKEASETNKLPVFGSIMFLDLSSTQTVEFVQYRTLGDRYNTLQRVIDTYLASVELPDPRNEDWSDVTRATQFIPAVDAPKNYIEAATEDAISKALANVNTKLTAMIAAQTTGYDTVVDKLTALNQKITAHDIDDHHQKQYAHALTAAQLNALGKDTKAVNTVKAYGYTLAQLAVLFNSLAVNTTDLDLLFKLIGDTLTGELRLDGSNVLIKNVAGTSVINLANGNLQLIAESGVSIASDTKDTPSAIPVGLRAGDNMLTVHSETGAFTQAVLYTTVITLAHPDAKALTVYNGYTLTNGVWVIYKQIYFAAGAVDFSIRADNFYTIAVDGVNISTGSIGSGTFTATGGYHWVSIAVTNGTGPSSVSASFTNGGKTTATDDTWWMLESSAANKAADLLNYPTITDNNAVYNGLFIIHAGNLADYLPEPDYDDTIIHVKSTTTIEFTGRAIESSPMVGTVYYPAATSSTVGIFKLSTSIYSTDKTSASTASAVKLIMDLANTKLSNTATVNGKRLNANITLSKSDLGLSNVSNLAPANKVTSNAFKTEVAKKAASSHSHPATDFATLPNGSATTSGIVKLTTTASDSEVLAATPVMLAATQLEYDAVESSMGGKMPSAPFDIMQYGGFGYLPAPVQGKYGAAGQSFYGAAGAIEANGDLVVLRNGADISDKGVYYWYATFKTNDTFDKVTATTALYQPTFIPNSQTVQYIVYGSSGVFTLKTSNNDVYIVLTRNTMDASKHVGAKVVNTNGLWIEDRGTNVSLWKDSVIFTYSYTGDNGVYFSVWSCSIADVAAGKDITLTRVQTQCVNWAGATTTKADTSYFTSVGKSTNAADRPILLDNDTADVWTTLQTRRGVLTTVPQVEGNNLRILIESRCWVYNTDTIVNTAFKFSYVIDLETMLAKGDNNAAYPITVTGTGYTFPAAFGSNYPFPNMGTGSSPTVFSSKGKHVHIRFHNSTLTTIISVYKDKNSTSFYDALNASVSDYTNITSTQFVGSYGSAALPNSKMFSWVPGNKLAVRQIDNSNLLAEYDINGYIDGTDPRGFGPTSNRTLIPLTEMYYYARTPMLWASGTLEGASLSLQLMSDTTKVTGNVASGSISWTTDVMEATLEKLRLANPVTDDDIFYEDRVMLHMFGDVSKNDVIVSYVKVVWTTAAKTSKNAIAYFHKATVSYVSGTITGVTLGTLLTSKLFASTVTAWNSFEDFGQNCKATLTDGNILYCINRSNYVNWVGYGGGCSGVFIFSPAGALLYSYAETINSPTVDGRTYHPSIGMFKISSAYAGEAISASVSGSTLEDISGGADYTSYIHSTQVASGLVVYFTEESRFFVNGVSYILPVQNIDLLFYGVPFANTTLNIYAELTTTDNITYTPKYVIRAARLEDTETSLFIGTVTCDGTKITKIDVKRATRLGNIYELDEHVNTPAAHPTVPVVSIDTFGLGNIKNMGMVSNITLPTFKDVFNSWIRISHKNTYTTQPAIPAELDSWTFDSATDTISNQTNTSGFVGLVSHTEVGDGLFDTIIGSTGSDDDVVAVILAYKVNSAGQQCTITATRSRNVAAVFQNASNFDIWYNYHQSDAILIASDTDVASLGGWSSNYSRITSTRTGNKFVVTATPFVKSKELSYHPINTSVIVHEFTLDDLPELALFKSGASFGYGAMSQPACNFYNVVRPDEDVSNYYASAEAVRIAANTFSNTLRVATGVVIGGGIIPIPAGFTEADCTFTLLYETSGGAGYVRYVRVTNVGMVVNIEARMSGSTTVYTNAAGSTARYYLIARKRAEV